MKYLTSIIKIITLIFAFGILNTIYKIPNTTYAENINLNIEPATLQIQAKTPADIHAPFTLTNEGSNSLEVKILFKRFRDSGDDTGKIIYSEPRLTNEKDRDAFFKTIRILDGENEIQTLSLGPKQKKQLDLQILLEKNSKATDHYFSIIFQTIPKADKDLNLVDPVNDTFSRVQSGLALPVLLSINPKSEPIGFLDSFTAPVAIQSGPVPFTIRVANTGDHFVTAKGIILITNMFGQTVGRIDLPASNILASSSRTLNSDAFEKDAKAIWQEKFLLGFYTAKLSLAISPEQTLYTRSIHFIALPFIGIGIAIAGLLIIFLILRRIKNKVSEQ